MFLIRSARRLTRNDRTLFGHIPSRHLRCEPLEERTLLAGVTFDVAASIPMGDSDFVQAEDLDHDGDQDLIVLSGTDADFSVFLNDGTGALGPEQRFETGNRPRKAAIADFTGDQILDLAIVTRTRGSAVSIHRGVGDGTFERMDDYATEGSTSAYVVAGDWDGDGDMDLATANQYSHDISVLFGNGDGTFSQPDHYHSDGQGTTGITAGDFDADGDMDLAAANYFGSTEERTVSVFLGNGRREETFAPAETYNSSASSWALRSADVNRDRHLDLVVTTIHGPSIMLGIGDGTFETAIHYATHPGTSHIPDFENPLLQPFGFDLGDLNGDGVLDLVLANWIGWYRDTGDEFGMLSVMLGVGDGTFEEPSIINMGGWPRAVTSADLDGDGDLDLATVGFQSVPLTILFNSPNTVYGPGDANMDGEFNQLDIVQVLQAAKYLTGSPATFEEGDWTGDGVFDQLDIVEALKAGTYLAGV